MDFKQLFSWFRPNGNAQAEKEIDIVEREIEYLGQLNALHQAALVSETDLQGNIIFANETFCQISKYEREELLGQNHRILKSGHQPQQLFEDLWKTISKGNVWKGRIKNKAKDGSYYWVAATITPVIGKDGKPVKYIGVRFDITEQIRLLEHNNQIIEEMQSHEEELQSHEEELRQTLEALYVTNEQLKMRDMELTAQLNVLHEAAIVSETDLEGNIIFVNDTFCKISEYTREELIGKNHRILKSGHQPQELFEQLWKTISSGKVWKGIVKNKTKNGNYYWVAATVAPALGADKKPTKYISVRFDITQQMAADAELKAQLKMIEQLNSELEASKAALEVALSVSNNDLHESMQYAQYIQKAILQTEDEIKKQLPACFKAAVLYQPKQLVGGDFYWVGTWRKKSVFVIGDGTGHGVPGAFMSIIGINAISKIVENRGITEPSHILEELDQEIINVLHQKEQAAVHDSLEMTVCVIEENNPEVLISSAMRPVFLVSGDQVTEFPASRFPVGGVQHSNKKFETYKVKLEPGSTLYLLSDGIAHQIGVYQQQYKKLGKNNLMNALKIVSGYPIENRPKLLKEIVADWRKDTEQTDDIIVAMLSYENIE